MWLSWSWAKHCYKTQSWKNHKLGLHLNPLDPIQVDKFQLHKPNKPWKPVAPQHERLKAENARQAEETARKNEVATLNATIATRDSEISVLKKQIEDYEKSNTVSKKVLKTLQVNRRLLYQLDIFSEVFRYHL